VVCVSAPWPRARRAWERGSGLLEASLRVALRWCGCLVVGDLDAEGMAANRLVWGIIGFARLCALERELSRWLLRRGRSICMVFWARVFVGDLTTAGMLMVKSMLCFSIVSGLCTLCTD
jgi:hypothetical protein